MDIFSAGVRVKLILVEVFIKANIIVVGPTRPKIMVIEIRNLDTGDKELVIPVDNPTVP